MFSSTTNQSNREKFIEATRKEREKREHERIQRQQLEKQTQAARTIQAWWKRREQRSASRRQCQAWWESSMDTPNELSLLDFYQLLGAYCILARHGVVLGSSSSSSTNNNNNNNNGLRRLVKCLTRNKFKHATSSSNSIVLPYYCLLIDMRYMERAAQYLEVVIVQCITECTSANDTTLFGPELTFLLQYLNPKTYATRHTLDACHVIDIPASILQSRAQTILKRTLCQFNLRDALLLCVQRMIKLQDRARGKDSDAATAKTLHACQLWLSTVTRLTLYPVENAELSSDALDMATACRFLWTNTLAVPCLTRLVSGMMADRLRTWALATVKPYLMDDDDDDDNDNDSASCACMDQLDGNGSLFLLANLVDLWNSEKNPQKEAEQGMQMVAWTAFFLPHMASRFSDKQSPAFPAYHPVFKWSKATWGNSLPSAVFDRVMDQLEYLWSRSFMDQLFADILQCDTAGHLAATAANKGSLFAMKKHPSHGSRPSDTMALFSIQVASIFAMYMQLTQVFKAHRRVIFYRIAFTSQLMPQLWRLMNCFGPKGNMVIYLHAAAKQADINREPLVQVLQVFCEACSIVFLTLDDVDIFKQQEPFSPSVLIDISRFLNQFYFSLIQQHTDVPSELPPAASAFKSARRLLLQIYDLDLHHPFCPPNHWLLIQSSSSSSIKSLFSSLFNESTKDTMAAMFLDKLKQGDPVPLRILQLMPHTVPFDMRLKIFREWIELDKYTCTKTANRHITVRRSQVLEDGYQQLVNLPASAWKGTIRVSFVNALGMEEAGIDQGGPFKDFLTMMIAEAFEPDYGLFSSTKTHSFYPSATSSIHGRHHIQLFEFIGKAIGKALYEGVLLDVQFAGFLLARLLGRNVFLEELKELDEEVWRNLTFVKHYDGNVQDLCLSFEADEQVFGKVQTHELKFRGKSTAVTNSNKIEYVYLMADYKLNQRAKEQTKALIRGFRTVISESWIRLFSPPELQRVLSGEDTDFDVNDLRKHTQYDNGYFDQHPVIRSLWQIVAEFNSTEKRAFLKFVTGCPKPPLGGFDYLQPAFTVRMVSIDSTNMDGTKLVKSFFKLNLNNNKSGRLPSSSTCFNLLKLPAYTKKSLLREKLVYGKYAILYKVKHYPLTIHPLDHNTHSHQHKHRFRIKLVK